MAEIVTLSVRASGLTSLPLLDLPPVDSGKGPSGHQLLLVGARSHLTTPWGCRRSPAPGCLRPTLGRGRARVVGCCWTNVIPDFMSKSITHHMHDPGSIVSHIRPKVFTDNQISRIKYDYYYINNISKDYNDSQWNGTAEDSITPQERQPRQHVA
jgi:hypothetical protein